MINMLKEVRAVQGYPRRRIRLGPKGGIAMCFGLTLVTMACMTGGTPSKLLLAVPPMVADLADACNCAPRSASRIAVDIILHSV